MKLCFFLLVIILKNEFSRVSDKLNCGPSTCSLKLSTYWLTIFVIMWFRCLLIKKGCAAFLDFNHRSAEIIINWFCWNLNAKLMELGYSPVVLILLKIPENYFSKLIHIDTHLEQMLNNHQRILWRKTSSQVFLNSYCWVELPVKLTKQN